jgi:hypothetical protein
MAHRHSSRAVPQQVSAENAKDAGWKPALPGTETVPAKPKRRALGSGEEARILVVGTPATLRPGQEITMQVGLRNMGGETWTSGDHPVRLVYRWYDVTNGRRSRWALQWLTSDVPAGAKVFVPLSVTAPIRSGSFRLTYSLVRIEGTHLDAPSATGADDPWPGELAAASVPVEVR